MASPPIIVDAPNAAPPFASSNTLLLHMFAHPVDRWVALQTDRCEGCAEWLQACWIASQDQRSSQSSLDLARYQQRYQIAVRCPVCQTELLTQHTMVRNV